MIPIKSTDRTPIDIQELEEMVAKLLETTRKLPAGAVRHDILKEKEIQCADRRTEGEEIAALPQVL
jgi:hypothetical protein